LPLLADSGSTLLVRMSGRTMTTVIVRDSNLSIYRSTEMAADPAALDLQSMLDEIFPAVAFYQDTWGNSPDRARITGFGAREEVFRRGLAEELKCPVGSLADSEGASPLEASARDLLQHDLDPLVGWMLNEG
jgi:hypothetical protein